MIYAVAVLAPFLALLVRGKWVQALLSLILQLTLIGWVPAMIWAILVINNDNSERRHREMLATLRNDKSVG
jgi:uncharacterized membrane protein YqaE (UPF0057 family)